MVISTKLTEKRSLAPNGKSHAREASVGFVLLDLNLKPVAVDNGAAKMLADMAELDDSCEDQENGSQIPKDIRDFIRNQNLSDLALRDARVRTGNGEYIFRVFQVKPQGGVALDSCYALLLEKDRAVDDAVFEVAEVYNLTEREQEALRGIALGLTSKELAQRMHISPNTVRAFLRLIMLKMAVTTRTGVVAKVLDHARNTG